jgi:hypothetical protein
MGKAIDQLFKIDEYRARLGYAFELTLKRGKLSYFARQRP